ncbi:hypothetical protein PIB30_114701, partial [Stylosanthes scabra]|nr:hypothetical protein [Stylosanthes scabra]
MEMCAISISSEIIYHLKRLPHRFSAILSFSSDTSSPVSFWDDRESTYSDVPRPSQRKSERKPYVTPMKVLIERAKKEREARKAQPCRVLEEPPDNGLLVPELVEVAQR